MQILAELHQRHILLYAQGVRGAPGHDRLHRIPPKTMKMITLGDTAIRISRITMVQRPYEYGKWVIRIYTPDKPNGIDGKFNTEQERNNVYDAVIDAIEEE